MGLFSKKTSDSQAKLLSNDDPFNSPFIAPPLPPKDLFADSARSSGLLPPEPPSMLNSSPTSFDMNQNSTQFTQINQGIQTNSQPTSSSFQTNNPAVSLGAPAPPPKKKTPQEATQDETIRAQQKLTEQEVEEFELPDFDESELSDLQEHEDGLPEINIPETNNWSNEPLFSKESMPNIQVQPVDEHIESKFSKIFSSDTLKTQTIDKNSFTNEKYLDLSDFLKLKETLTDAKNLARSTEDQLILESYKPRLDKYASFSSSLNTIQDKLMLIDAKLFDTPEVNK